MFQSGRNHRITIQQIISSKFLSPCCDLCQGKQCIDVLICHQHFSPRGVASSWCVAPRLVTYLYETSILIMFTQETHNQLCQSSSLLSMLTLLQMYVLLETCLLISHNVFVGNTGQLCTLYTVPYCKINVNVYHDCLFIVKLRDSVTTS